MSPAGTKVKFQTYSRSSVHLFSENKKKNENRLTLTHMVS